MAVCGAVHAVCAAEYRNRLRNSRQYTIDQNKSRISSGERWLHRKFVLICLQG